MDLLGHFALASFPFSLAPDTRLYFPFEEDEALLAALTFALERGDGFLKVTGAVGSGKTLLCRLLLERLGAQAVDVAFVNAALELDQISTLRVLGRAFGLDLEGASAEAALEVLTSFFLAQQAKGRRAVLVADEAQALGAGGLETIRLLSNLGGGARPLLQLVLFGQDELDALLARPALRSLRQRVTFSFRTKTMAPEVMGPYLAFRMNKCAAPKASPRACFSREAIQELAQASGGCVRLVHLLADKALLAAYAEGAAEVEAHHVRAAQKETPGVRGFSFWEKLLRSIRR